MVVDMRTAPNVLTAAALARDIAAGRHTAREAVEASLAAIDALDETLQAFITVDAVGARDAAAAADRRAKSLPQGTLPPLHGVPVAIKDLIRTKGLRTTFGSHVHRDNVPQVDDLSVARLRRAGAIIVGKTNTPAFGFGAACTNSLRGPTANPWNVQLTSGGSSGGSAVAVAAGMVPVALGTDFGGSVRTPASFCGCLSLRPTPGRIPEPDRPLAWASLATQGILARSSEDLGLMLNALAGPDDKDPVSATAFPSISPDGLSSPLRIAASCTLGGAFAVDEAVAVAFDASVDRFASVFGDVEDAAPDVTGGIDAFKTLRAAESWFKFADLVEAHPDDLPPSFVWNVRQGRSIGADQYLRAEATRSRIYRSFQAFFDRHDIMVLPSASVLPFPHAQEDVLEVGGHPVESIIDYLACTFLVSLVGCPALSFPIHWTPEGLPFGVQLVARPGHEAVLLSAAARLEQAGLSHRWPPLGGLGEHE